MARRKRTIRTRTSAQTRQALPVAPVASREAGRQGSSTRWVLLAAGAILLSGLAAYSNSFSGPFIYDGKESITDNPYIRKLFPLSYSMQAPPNATTSGRPVVCLSLAACYAINTHLSRDGLDVRVYHAWNLAIHLAGALLLFGIVRRTLLTWRLKERFGRHATLLAGLCAGLWALHPLQTQAVTYVVQRAESMMGMFYLLTVYLCVRGLQSRRAWLWFIPAVVACAIGMATKEVMATAPVMVFAYDRIFIAKSFRDGLGRRIPLYAALAATWVVLVMLVHTGPRSGSAGFGLETLTAPEYAQTQCKAILHYIRLAFWPSPLVLDYTRKAARQFAEYAPAGAALLVLLGVTVAAARYVPAAGFLGVWFFVILGPTSSFLPIADPVFEHRMYLSLAGIVCGVVLGGYWIVNRLAREGRALSVIAILLAGLAASAMGQATYLRNRDYRDEETIWRDTVSKQPDNFMAWSSLAANLANQGKYADAIEAAGRSIELYPKISYAFNSRGVAHGKMGNYQQAIADFTKAIEVHPTHARAHSNRAAIYKAIGRIDDAIADATEAARLNPRYAPTFTTRAACYMLQRRFQLAANDYTAAIALDPRNLSLYTLRAVAWDGLGQWEKALSDYRTVMAMAPGDPRPYNARGFAYKGKARYSEAIGDFGKAISLDANFAAAWCNRGMTYLELKDYERAISDLSAAIRLDQRFSVAYNSRAVAYASKGDLSRALADVERAIACDPSNTSAIDNRRAILARMGRTN